MENRPDDIERNPQPQEVESGARTNESTEAGACIGEAQNGESGRQNSAYGFNVPPYQPMPHKEKKGVSISSLIAIIVLTVVVTYQITSLGYTMYYGGSKADDIPDYYSSALTISDYLNTYYIGELDEDLLKDALAAALLHASGDLYAYYYTAEEYAEETLSYAGNAVGIGIRVVYLEDPGGLEILRVMKDTPAEKAGLLVGDVIVGVDGEDVTEWEYSEILMAVQGEPGSTVRIEVIREGARRSFEVVRSEYVQQTVEYHMYKDGATAKKIGVVRVFTFNDSTPGQFKTAVEALSAAGAQGLVFDMRENPGGSLDSVVEMLDYLLPKGTIVRITDKDGNEVQQYTSDESCVELPMAVLTNGNTASAAELFTSALKDYQKAISVGTKTYGKGTMQCIIPLPDGAAFKFSYRYYSPPFSENYHGIGISPEIEVTVPEGTVVYRLTDEDDAQLAAAVGYLVSGEVGSP
ncbi:MAG: PDZ domain-containing protein [Clostridia bacterium]|nr:PDZ domain-containing protein [Clostridia bacterium]